MSQRTEKAYLEYKKQKRKTKELIINAKNKSCEEFGKEMEEKMELNQKLFYNIVESTRKKKLTLLKQIKDKNEQIV